MTRNEVERLSGDRDIRRAVKNMTRRGESMEKMRRVIGLPYEIIDKHRQQTKNEMKKKKPKKPRY
jgi:hypothetical protein